MQRKADTDRGGVGMAPAGLAPRGALSSVQMAVGVCFEASSLENFKQGEDRQIMYGKLISNGAQNCSSCHLNLLSARGRYLLSEQTEHLIQQRLPHP